MFREQRDQLSWDVDDPFGPELRCHKLRRPAGLALQLVTDGEGSTKEVDVTDLQPRGLAKTQSSGVGIVIAAAALRVRGNATPADGSALMTRSSTAARSEMWT